ncbi:hypothetical protein EG68_12639 [Paragonimus skrjabini miyazakii]|uniref:Uncharacterized protein n=1 Tax=Paragonimus skrjabini miyazakii TaxID=59628 RepID=A0A8S9YG05_9TREM|nr:hypothetical protein EG68_12639 [Paragonimus skrjabini miyazakii]
MYIYIYVTEQNMVCCLESSDCGNNQEHSCGTPIYQFYIEISILSRPPSFIAFNKGV